jgi:hypothetical protein
MFVCFRGFVLYNHLERIVCHCVGGRVVGRWCWGVWGKANQLLDNLPTTQNHRKCLINQPHHKQYHRPHPSQTIPQTTSQTIPQTTSQTIPQTTSQTIPQTTPVTNNTTDHTRHKQYHRPHPSQTISHPKCLTMTQTILNPQVFAWSGGVFLWCPFFQFCKKILFHKNFGGGDVVNILKKLSTVVFGVDSFFHFFLINFFIWVQIFPENPTNTQGNAPPYIKNLLK